jgi:hypothetical protein
MKIHQSKEVELHLNILEEFKLYISYCTAGFFFNEKH